MSYMFRQKCAGNRSFLKYLRLQLPVLKMPAADDECKKYAVCRTPAGQTGAVGWIVWIKTIFWHRICLKYNEFQTHIRIHSGVRCKIWFIESLGVDRDDRLLKDRIAPVRKPLQAIGRDPKFCLRTRAMRGCFIYLVVTIARWKTLAVSSDFRKTPKRERSG